jgi:hypothetical protein
MPEGWAMDGLEGAPSEAGRIPKKESGPQMRAALLPFALILQAVPD